MDLEEALAKAKNELAKINADLAKAKDKWTKAFVEWRDARDEWLKESGEDKEGWQRIQGQTISQSLPGGNENG